MSKEIQNTEPDPRIVYADIFDLPHWQSPNRKTMSLYERASIFSSFAALAGYEDMVNEEARIVSKQEKLTEEEMETLNWKINLIADILEDGHHPILTFTYFLNDKMKEGGSYVKMTERVRKVDTVNHRIELYKTVGTSQSYMELDMDKIKDISGDILNHISDSA
ncbi:MAG: hypothetical protein IKW96_12730 [Ruminococcus sp.]|uniref:hypothetical protein n=1 Tax=Ruminococcus sp. TaxID=41978 RepID=UPI0025F8B39C|nr:hypothetical protein [Ruminococcus sp.]MBR5684115.1 hypothetical protein [Ruminococcus sp.]